MSTNKIINSFRAQCIRVCIEVNILFILLGSNKLLKAYEILNQIKNIRQKAHGIKKIKKFIRVGGKYYSSVNIPGWPSKAFNKFIKGELKRINKPGDISSPLQTAIVSITNICPLKCIHCYEWKNLNSPNNLLLEDLEHILNKLISSGLPHIQLSGGEPLCRFDDLLSLIKTYSKDLDFWILTSGFELSYKKCLQLKAAGLTGIIISLDHWNEHIHNQFRNNNQSFFWAKKAVQNCLDAKLVVSLSLCATNSFVNTDNLLKYLNLAKEWGAGFIRILEPRQVGHFNNKRVSLYKDRIKLLDNFFIEKNSAMEYKSHPIILYPGFHQRRIGCFGAGNRYLYIDSNGNIHGCPFCNKSTGNALSDSLESIRKTLKKYGCLYYANYNHIPTREASCSLIIP